VRGCGACARARVRGSMHAQRELGGREPPSSPDVGALLHASSAQGYIYPAPRREDPAQHILRAAFSVALLAQARLRARLLCAHATDAHGSTHTSCEAPAGASHHGRARHQSAAPGDTQRTAARTAPGKFFHPRHGHRLELLRHLVVWPLVPRLALLLVTVPVNARTAGRTRGRHTGESRRCAGLARAAAPC
jgi:hypothetical protein